MIVERAREATDELAGAFARLLPQLTRGATPPGRAELAEMARSRRRTC